MEVLAMKNHVKINILKCFLFVSIMLLFILSSIGCSTYNSNSKKPSKGSTQSIVTTKAWYTIEAYEGRNSKTTSIFKISSNTWRVNWSTVQSTKNPMVFQLYLFDSTGKVVTPGVIANTVGNKSGTTNISKSGNYYLYIVTAQKYKITVEELK
jgi:hypothetical protein